MCWTRCSACNVTGNISDWPAAFIHCTGELGRGNTLGIYAGPNVRCDRAEHCTADSSSHGQARTDSTAEQRTRSRTLQALTIGVIEEPLRPAIGRTLGRKSTDAAGNASAGTNQR